VARWPVAKEEEMTKHEIIMIALFALGVIIAGVAFWLEVLYYNNRKNKEAKLCPPRKKHGGN